MSNQLFNYILNGIKSWAAVFQSIEAFEPLAREIFRREGLPFPGLQNLTPGTNAVFRAGKLVVKIFAPPESGFDGEYAAELVALQLAGTRGVAAPKLLAHGVVEDSYTFPYMLIEYVNGCEAGNILPDMTRDERGNVAMQIREIITRYNQASEVELPRLTAQHAAANPRLNNLPTALAAEIRRHIETLDFTNPVSVHGDITGENTLVCADGSVMLIDFADAMLAPAWYEYAAIVFELFQADADMADVFAGGETEFLRRLVDSVCVHQFGASIIQDFCVRIRAEIPETLDSLRKLVARRL